MDHPFAPDGDGPPAEKGPAAGGASRSGHKPSDTWRIVLVCLFLVLAAGSVYLQVRNHGFVSFDDSDYVTQNGHVLSGLNAESMEWAFSYSRDRRSYWHPLTWLSHMTDVELWGLDAGKHHLTNLFIHIINALLLFTVLGKMTGALWRSAFVAALFALHPMNVDSVAWIAERKNLLSTLFWLLVMLAYIPYAKRPSLLRYLVVAGFFVLGLLSKPMLVTLPFVLLLLDFWPLGRAGEYFALAGEPGGPLKAILSGAARLVRSPVVLEKIPLIILSFLAVYIATLSLSEVGIITSLEKVPLGLRIENAFVTYGTYLWKMLWPSNLAFYYPYPHEIPLWKVAAAVLAVSAVTAAAAAASKKHPYLLVGWLWYCGTLVPVSGIYQSGLWPAMADRWAYVPFIGLFIMIAWGVPALLGGRRFAKPALAAAAVMVIPALMKMTALQAGYWKDDYTLFKHAVDVTEGNHVAHNNLGKTLADGNDPEGALFHYREAIRHDPCYTDAYNNLGNALTGQGRHAEAVEQFARAIEIDPGYFPAHVNMGRSLAGQGKFSEAVKAYRKGLEIEPGSIQAHYNLASALLSQGRLDEARKHYGLVLGMSPGFADVQALASSLKARADKLEAATADLRKALAAEPGNAGTLRQLGHAYRRGGDLGSAAGNYEKALAIDGSDGETLGLLANIYAAWGEYGRAERLLERIIGLQPENADAYYNIACMAARQNKVDEALARLRQAVAKGFDKWDLIGRDPDLENIRDTAYVTGLMKDRGVRSALP